MPVVFINLNLSTCLLVTPDITAAVLLLLLLLVEVTSLARESVTAWTSSNPLYGHVAEVFVSPSPVTNVCRC